MSESEFFVEFTPLGEANKIVLTPSIVKDFLMVKTARGIEATKADVRKFLEMCAAQGLNPWLGDAFLIGYDTYDQAKNHTGANFSLVTSHQAILKRAEANSQYDGMRSGVIALPKTVAKQIGETGLPPDNFEDLVKRREGDLLYPWETVIGGWADVKRKDHSLLSSDALEFEVYTTGRSRWLKDPAGMIVKCAEASAQRKAFPSTLGQLYIQEEMESVREGRREVAGLSDGRSEQDANKIVIPAEVVQQEKIVIPAGRTEETKRPDEETRERLERPEPEVKQESVWPIPIENLLGAAKRAKSELSLTSIRQGWLAIKADYNSEIVEHVETYLKRRLSEVTPVGEKPKS